MFSRELGSSGKLNGESLSVQTGLSSGLDIVRISSGAVLGKDVWDVFRVGAVNFGCHQEEEEEEEGRCLMQPNVLNHC